MTIKVTVDGSGGYTCDPARKDKDKGKGRITWKLETKGYHFVSPYITWGTQSPTSAPAPIDVFEAPQPNKTFTQFTVEDNNSNGSVNSHYDYPYTLYIAADPAGKSSKRLRDTAESVSTLRASSDPVIRNQPK
jgi:hypothetical protein